MSDSFCIVTYVHMADMSFKGKLERKPVLERTPEVVQMKLPMSSTRELASSRSSSSIQHKRALPNWPDKCTRVDRMT